MDPLDGELLSLMSKLGKLHVEFGGTKAGTGANGQPAAVLEDGKMDRFVDIQRQIEEKLLEVQSTMQSLQILEKEGGNPKDTIAAQSKIRSLLLILADDLRELDNVHKTEARKRRVRHSCLLFDLGL